MSDICTTLSEDLDLGYQGAFSPMRGEELSIHELSPPIINRNESTENRTSNSYVSPDHSSSTPSSTLFDNTAPIPTNDSLICPYCNKNFRKVNIYR
jgi:hypothetical protein